MEKYVLIKDLYYLRFMEAVNLKAADNYKIISSGSNSVPNGNEWWAIMELIETEA